MIPFALGLLGIFLVLVDMLNRNEDVENAIDQFRQKWVLAGLLPAFFLAGAIAPGAAGIVLILSYPLQAISLTREIGWFIEDWSFVIALLLAIPFWINAILAVVLYLLDQFPKGTVGGMGLVSSSISLIYDWPF